MSLRRVTLMLAVLLLGPTACSSSSAPSATHATPSAAQDCRGATETARGAPSPDSTVQYVSMLVDGKLRDYRLFRPTTLSPTEPVPLVVMLHGSPSDAAGFESVINFDAEATTAGLMYAAPNGCGGFWPYADRAGPITPDEDFIRQMIDQLERQFRIDKSRVLVVGASAGSWVTYRMACDLSDQISGIVSISGTMRLTDSCMPSRPVSILEMHGTLDRVHPWNGGGPHAAFPVDAVMQRWVMLDGCAANPSVTQSGITVTSTWNQCSQGSVARLDKVVGGHHQWFGSDLDPVPGEPDANATIWSFLKSLKPAA